MPPAAKKYKLFSAATVTDKGSALPCAFFASPQGCRNGDNCKFLHVLPGEEAKTNSSPPGAGASSSSVVSTESEGGGGDGSMFAAPGASKNQKQQQQQQQQAHGTQDAKSDKKKKRKNKKRKSNDGKEVLNDGKNIFAAPKKNTGTTPTSSQPDKKKQKVTQETAPGSFAAMAKQQPPPSVSQTSTNNRAPPQEKHKTARGAKTQKQDNLPNFRAMNLPISTFSLPSTKKEEKEAAQSSDTPQDEEPPAPPTKPTPPLPKSTPTGLKWQKAVLQSRAHERYDGYFDFEKYKEMDEAVGRGNASDWIKARPFGPWCSSNPQAIAIDCEMCETQDPVSGITDPKALCRISIINAEKPEEVLLDTLVKPAWPVVDYRSWINGIKQEHLEKVEFTLRHAQAFMMALCSEETVIVGHAVHNDLAALKMEHHCNVDSAFLFSVKDAPDATPSLKDLAMAILKKEMPTTHDSVNDARAALMCLESYVERDGKVDPIERTYVPKNRIYASQLFVHRIPKMCKTEHLSSMFLAHTSIQPSEVGEIEFSGDTGKTLITFSSSRHANLAFDTLEGKEEAEKSGRMQKKVYLRNGDYVRVRKMAFQKPKQQQPKV